jgi:hypothetical protein
MSFTGFSYRLEALLSLLPSDGGTHKSILLVQHQQIALIVKSVAEWACQGDRFSTIAGG